jgi:hypothetical protein
MAMTPEKERELIYRMITAFAGQRSTCGADGPVQSMRAALAVAAPILRDDALGEAEAVCKAIMLRQPAPEDPADQAHNYALEHACTRIRSLKTKDKPE